MEVWPLFDGAGQRVRVLQEQEWCTTGAAVGSDHREGGTSTYLCLHNQPEFLRTSAGLQDLRGRLYGTEYEVLQSPPAFSSMLRHDVPCSVCHTPTRSTKIIIPGRITCPASWTREYYGYLMSDAWYTSQKGKVPVCIDENAESIPGSATANIRSLLYFIETTCIGIACPPYFEGAEITCVVCTK